MMNLLAAIVWQPGFKGILVTALSVGILCGSVALILGTNSGARLGFQLALTGLLGWFVVMGIVWTAYGIGYKGSAPSWKLVDVVEGPVSGSRIDTAQNLPLPTDEGMPDPVAIRDASEELLKEFPTTGRTPTLSDLVMFDEQLKDQLNEKAPPWRILETSNKYTGEAQSVVAERLGPDDKGLFDSAADYVVLDTWVTGGKTGRTSDSTLGRIKYKITSTAQVNSPPLYAAVQLQAVIPQETIDGQAPPLPIADPDAPVYTVILERDRGQLRLPAFGFTVFSAICFGISAEMLHRRDKLVAANRAAPAGAGA